MPVIVIEVPGRLGIGEPSRAAAPLTPLQENRLPVETQDITVPGDSTGMGLVFSHVPGFRSPVKAVYSHYVTRCRLCTCRQSGHGIEH